MSEKSESNHGEGNPEAASRFNAAEQAFVESKRGKAKIKQGPQVRPQEEAALHEAERVGRGPAKDDPNDSM